MIATVLKNIQRACRLIEIIHAAVFVTFTCQIQINVSSCTQNQE